MSILVVSSLIGNTLIITIVIRTRAMRKPVHLLMVNLAFCDSLFSLFLIPRFILNHAFHHPVGSIGDYFCKFITGGNLTWVGGVASVYTLVTISLERFYAVVRPLKIRGRFNMTKAKRAVVGSWFASMLVCLPLFFVLYYDVNEDFCLENWQDGSFQKVYTITWGIVVGVIPFSLMVGFYSRVALVLWGGQREQATRRAVYASRRKITKIALLVTLIFFVTWFSDLAYYLFEGFASDSSWYIPSSVAQRLIQIATAFNAACNPFIYAFQSMQFRRSITDILCLRQRRRISDQFPSLQEMSFRSRIVREQVFGRSQLRRNATIDVNKSTY